MTRPWKQFTDSPRDTQVIDGPPPTVAERAKDDRYANDFSALVAIYRIDLEGKDVTAFTVANQLQRLRRHLTEAGPTADGLFEQQCFSDWGPQILLRALAKAYEQPAHVLGQLEGD